LLTQAEFAAHKGDMKSQNTCRNHWLLVVTVVAGVVWLVRYLLRVALQVSRSINLSEQAYNNLAGSEQLNAWHWQCHTSTAGCATLKALGSASLLPNGAVLLETLHVVLVIFTLLTTIEFATLCAEHRHWSASQRQCPAATRAGNLSVAFLHIPKTAGGLTV
jgi:hypothetical protein